MYQAAVVDYRDEELARHAIDWDAPELRTLLQKTEGWQLDNRAVPEPIPCELFIGWGVGTGKRATCVYEKDRLMVVAATWIIPKGETVRVDYVQGGVRRCRWGVVAEGRPGRRAEDAVDGTHVYWIHRT
ncbi:MAG: hypothetical protein ABI178_04085 [Rhodanobacter sp.]